MSKIKLRNSKQKLSEADINDFERQANLTLPSNYRKFISKFNGGLVEDNDDIKMFLSIKHGNNTVEYIREIHQVAEKNIPANYLAIATDWANNPITICNQGNDAGKIVKFYFDTDHKPEIMAASLEEILGVQRIDDL